MRKKLLSLVKLVFVVSLLMISCNQKVETSDNGNLKGTITVSGAFAIYPLMTTWTQEFQKIHPDVQFDVSAGGAGKGMTDVLSKAVDIGMISRPISPEEEERGAYWIAIAKDAVFPVVNANNPLINKINAKGISQEMFIKIFITEEIKTWGEVVGDPSNTDAIHVYTRSDACGAGDVWAKFLGNRIQNDIQGIGVNGDPAVLDAVVKDPLGVGYNNLGYVFDLSSGKMIDGVLIAPIDVNNNGIADSDEGIDSLTTAISLIASEKYPSPPARLEFLATDGKPTGLTQAFLQWILSDGQSYVVQAGYVQLTASQLEESLNKIK